MSKIFLYSSLVLIIVITTSFDIFAQVEEDFDNDGDVDGSDLAVIQIEYGRNDCELATPCAGDIHPYNQPDGDVDENDLAAFARALGQVDSGGIDCLVLGDSIGAATHTNDSCDRAPGDHRELMECLELRLGSHDPAWSYLGGSMSWSLASRLCEGETFNTSRDGDEWKDALSRAWGQMQSGRIRQVLLNLGSNDVCAEYNHNYGSLAFVQTANPGNMVSIEAEHFIQRLAGTTHRWVPDNLKPGASISAVRSRPNNGTRLTYPDYLTDGPRLDYRVHFIRAGLHFVWIRGYATGSNNNSVHIGLNGQRQTNAEGVMINHNDEWAWSGTTEKGAYAFVDIPSIGEHTLNIYMHEDGFRLDKIVLLADSEWVPSGTGPNESARGTFKQEQSSPDLVSIETEHYHNMQKAGIHHWKPDYQAGYSGGGALRALPNDGTVHDINSSVRLDYNVEFHTTGTYYVWIRAFAVGRVDDSVHVGLDGTGTVTSEGIKIRSYSNWTWSNCTQTDAVATLDILEPGIHTVNVWMHKAGIRLDKLLLTSSSVYQPSGHGPDEKWGNDLGRIAGHIDDTLMFLSENLPLSGKIYWSGIFDVTRFYDLMVNRKHDHVFKKCSYLWNLDLDSENLQGDAKNSLCKGELGYLCELLPSDLQDELLEMYLEQFLTTFDSDVPCGRLLDSRNSQADRDEARRFNKSLNDLMEQKAEQYQGRRGVDINFTQILWYSSDVVRPYFISRIDCYHPNRLGQLKLAQTIWAGHHPEFTPTDEYFFDGFDDSDRCTQEFTSWSSCWYDGGDGEGQCGDEFICSVDNSGWYKFGKESNDKEDHWLARDVGDLSDKSAVWAFFKHKRDGFDNDDMDWVSFKVWTGSNWQTIEKFSTENDAGNHCSRYYNLTEYKDAVPFVIQFKTNNSDDMKNGDKLMFDDFTVFSW
jgi:hypothetical protein